MRHLLLAARPDGQTTRRQSYTPWGAVRAGDIPATTRDFTGQRKDATGLLYYGARYYDPQRGQFTSADSIVPGSASGKGGAAGTLGQDSGAALRPLTVDFHAPGFAATLAAEDAFTQARGFWFQLSDQDKLRAKADTGPSNSQALNRYSYVLNNPLRYVDPTGHAQNKGRVINASNQTVIIAGEKAHEEQYRVPECVGESWDCFYWEAYLLPGQDSDDLGFVDVDTIKAVPGQTLEGRGTQERFKLLGHSLLIVRPGNYFTNGEAWLQFGGCQVIVCGWWIQSNGSGCGNDRRTQAPCPAHLDPGEDSGDGAGGEFSILPPLTIPKIRSFLIEVPQNARSHDSANSKLRIYPSA